MNALTFQVRALQPLLLTTPGAGEENSAATATFISGSAIRGMVIARYLETHPVEDLAGESTTRRLFFDGTVRYLNGYPANRLQGRTLPTPLSWRIEKDLREDPFAPIYDLAVESDETLENLASVGRPFWWQAENATELYRPDSFIAVHNSSQRRGIKRKGTSTVYRYEAISAGALFAAAIIAEEESDLQSLMPLLDGAELPLGRSRSAGYGRVRIENARIEADWREYAPGEDPDDVVVVTLLSDAILRDANGEYTTDLGAVLGWKAERAYWQSKLVGGFSGKWRLPLPQAVAVQAGSVYVFRAEEVDRTLLRRLEHEGVGERRVEGFGRIAVNCHTESPRGQQKWSPEIRSPVRKQLSLESRALAERMAERLLRANLDRKLVKEIDRLQIDDPPEKAQLSRLRLVARRAARENNPQLLLEHLDNLKAARGQFERARVGNEKFLYWLREAVEQNRLWEQHFGDIQPVAVAGVRLPAPKSLQVEYSMRLLDALLRKTARNRKE